MIKTPIDTSSQFLNISHTVSSGSASLRRSSTSSVIAMQILLFIFLIPSLVSVAVVIVLWITYQQAQQVVRRRSADDEEDDLFEEEEISRDLKSELDDRYSSIPEDYVDQIADRERKESSNSSSSSSFRRRLRTDSQQAIEKVLTILVNPMQNLKQRTASFDHALAVFSGRKRRLSLYQMDGGTLRRTSRDPGGLLRRRKTQAIL